MRTAILMLNLGGPPRLEDVEPFLARLFSDPEIIDFPFSFLFRGALARWIARKRAPLVRERYAMIGGGSPILRYTELQARGLEQRLGPGHVAFPCMRYWHPDSERAVRDALASEPDRILLLPLYPQCSDATTGSSEREARRWLEKLGAKVPVLAIRSWCDHAGYLDAMAARVRKALASLPAPERERAFVLYSAHSLPMKIVEKGDPYPKEIEATVAGIRARLGIPNPWALSFQSRVGPIRWLTPSTEGKVVEIGDEGHESVVVVPVSFVSDHIETLHELDIDLAQRARTHGIESFVRAPSLNDGADFLDALADVVRRSLAKEIAA
jgi:ferrochelatase